MIEKELKYDLNLALQSSRGAGDIIMKYYKHDYEIKEKGYHNPVTTADNEADDFLKKLYWMQDLIMDGYLKKP
ncbi:MAG: hypothetical protein ACJZ19_00755 [Candidatus Neomarinimicrobiota bacterium]